MGNWLSAQSPWPERDDELRKHWESGLSTIQIAKAMRLTKNSIVGRAHRLNLPGRPLPIIRSGAPKAKAPSRRQAVNLVVAALAPESAVEALEAEPPPAPVKRFLKSEPCCWPIGELRTPAFRYCEAPSVPGKSYCEAHHGIGVVGTAKLQAATVAKLLALR